MIGFDFEYYRPRSLQEAAGLFQRLKAAGKCPVYYAGGTELITFSRVDRIQMGAVIDIKAIPETFACGIRDRELVIGASVTLSDLFDHPVFPLLAVTGGRVADRTARNKITVGGNLLSHFIYKEAVLPFLLADSRMLLAGPRGLTTASIIERFDRELRLADGEWLVQMMTDQKYLSMPYFSVKKRKSDVIGYPLLTLAALKTEEGIRLAISGLCDFPFRSGAIENILNDRSLSQKERIKQAIHRIPAPVRDDWLGSREYRLFVLKNTLEDMFQALGG
ncbi:MAG TPA: FAD binding domain-containing protein [Bacillales bacterium]|nr:FAD binding domain-containing protein [Bacillales bacterium]